MDRPEAGAVASGHILVEGLDGISTREFTELLVHVVCARTRVVTEPDAEVLRLQRLLLVDLEKARREQKTVSHSAMVSTHSACHLNGCKGQQRGYDTDDVHANDFTTGFLDLVHATVRKLACGWVASTCARTAGSTRNETWQRLHLAQRCAYGRSWEWECSPLANGGR